MTLDEFAAHFDDAGVDADLVPCFWLGAQRPSWSRAGRIRVTRQVIVPVWVQVGCRQDIVPVVQVGCRQVIVPVIGVDGSG